MNYIDKIAGMIARDIGDQPNDDGVYAEINLYRNYAVLLLAKGVTTTPEDVHNAWSAWQASIRPRHHSLIPFEMLNTDTQALDAPYVLAIHRVARRLGAPDD